MVRFECDGGAIFIVCRIEILHEIEHKPQSIMGVRIVREQFGLFFQKSQQSVIIFLFDIEGCQGVAGISVILFQPQRLLIEVGSLVQHACFLVQHCQFLVGFNAVRGEL